MSLFVSDLNLPLHDDVNHALEQSPSTSKMALKAAGWEDGGKLIIIY